MIGWIVWIGCALWAAAWLAIYIAIAIRVRKLMRVKMEHATELALLKSGYELEGKIW